MTPEFVRYTPDVETLDPNLEDVLTDIIAFWERKGRESPTVEGSGRAVRGAHAKSFGLVKGEVQFLHNIPPAYAQGIYATPGRHGALLRFSSTSGHLGTDVELGAGLGCALKIFDVPGTKLLDEEPDATTFDLVLKNNTMFISNSARHYLVSQEVVNDAPRYLARGKEGFRDLLSDFLTGRGTLERDDWAWPELFAFVRAATQIPVRNPLLTAYTTMAAVRHGDHIAKVRLAPGADSAARVIHRELDLHSRAEVFGSTLTDELLAGGFAFDLQVQLCTDLEKMPVDDSTVDWPEALSPWVTIGRLLIPQQDISGPENAEASDALAFNQWRVTDAHRPLGEIMHVRRIYTASAKVRRTINHQSQVEPASADAVLP